MNTKKDLSLVNCIATGLLAYFFTIPVHEFFHALTHLAYGNGVLCYSAGAVQDMNLVDFGTLSPFHRIMLGGGSASILNAIIGLVLFLIVLKAKMGPNLRAFMIQLTGAQLSCGFGYFMIGGLFGAGDWGNVYSYLEDMPGLITALRVILSILGCLGVVLIFFMLNYMSYYFIEDNAGKSEKIGVAAKLYLTMLIFGFVVGMAVTALSPANQSGDLNLGLGALYNMMWITFFWGFMFTGVMKVFPPKKSRFLYKLPAKPNWILLILALVLIAVDIFVFGPGIWFH